MLTILLIELLCKNSDYMYIVEQMLVHIYVYIELYFYYVMCYLSFSLLFLVLIYDIFFQI